MRDLEWAGCFFIPQFWGGEGIGTAGLRRVWSDLGHGLVSLYQCLTSLVLRAIIGNDGGAVMPFM